MKKILVALLVLTIVTPAGYLAAQKAKKPSSITDYYLIYAPGSLKLKGANWYALDIEGDFTLEVTADLDNGFLTWKNPGTGGGTTTYEVALFLKSDKTVILAIGENNFDGVGENSSVNFFVYRNGKFVQIKSGILPAITPAMLIDPSPDKSLAAEYGRYLDSVTVKYSLPRYGTTILAGADYSHGASALYASDEPSKRKDNVLAFIQKSFPYKLELNWDMKKGVFTVGKKIKK